MLTYELYTPRRNSAENEDDYCYRIKDCYTHGRMWFCSEEEMEVSYFKVNRYKITMVDLTN